MCISQAYIDNRFAALDAESPIPWRGGKNYLSKKIVQMIPADHLCYCEVFCGSAKVFFAKPKSPCEVLNDINRELISFFRVLQHHPQEFVRCLRFMVASREEFEFQKMLPPEQLTDIQRAVRFYYLSRNSFGNRLENISFGYGKIERNRFYTNNLAEKTERIYQRFNGVTIENLPYEELIARYDGEKAFFYLDPPYYNCEDYYGKNIFAKSDFDKLADILSKIKGKFLLSINDLSETREIFKNFKIEQTDVVYSCNNNTSKKENELFISNY